MFLFERNPRSTIKKGRKAPKTTVVCCRTSDALKAEVDALCRRNNLTTSELVKNFIEECVKRDSTTWWEGEAQKRIELVEIDTNHLKRQFAPSGILTAPFILRGGLPLSRLSQ